MNVLILFVAILIFVLLLMNTYYTYQGREVRINIMQPVPPEKLVLLDEYGFEAAVKEERRQMAFERFCMDYNEEHDYFCSKPAGHDSVPMARNNKVVREHGYAGIFWEA